MTTAPGRLSRALGLPALVLFALQAGLPVSAAAQDDHPIVLAYYYIWYEEASWDRAKVDFPVLGRYSSDDREVMVQHVRWAKEAGITGFIVSWKGTERLTRRLEQLIDVSRAEGFKLAIIYQGLDFERRPISRDQIAADFQLFADTYADDPVFLIFDRPVVVWSGTWEFEASEIAAVTGGVDESLLVLGSERNLDGYRRVAPHVEGNAYYWSSVNPETFPGYEEKLAGMGSAVHADGGIWIAPAAVGFDARLIGGERVVERAAGANLLRQMNAATASSPDAIGLISWNEFSENSHIEPSVEHGDGSLQTLASILHAELPPVGLIDSSEALAAAPADDGSLGRVTAVLAIVALTLAAVLALMRRGRTSP